MPEECLEFKPKKAAPWMRRLISAAAVLALVICIPVTANAFSWEDVWEFFARWAKETFSFVSGEDTEVNEPSPDNQDFYSSLKQLLEENNIPTNIIPSWIPAGYVLKKIEQDITPLQEVYRAYYANGDSELMILVQTCLSEDNYSFEIEEGNPEIYTVSGIDYYLLINKDQITAAWVADHYQCSISGDLTIEEIKMMIDSIGKG